MTIDYTQILTRKYADAEWTINGDEYTGLTWLSNSPKPTKATLDNLWPTVQTEILSEKEAQIAKKDSALSKLAALGLTEDEVKAIFG
jgi:hypothetical protein